MHHSLLPFLLFLLSIPITYTIYIPITPDVRRQERIESFEAQKPLPTSVLLASGDSEASAPSFPSPLPVGSHPLAADPKQRKLVMLFDDDIEDLKHEMEDLRTGMERLRGKLETMERKAYNDDER